MLNSWEKTTEAIIKATDAKPGDLLMFGADKSEIVAAALGAIRTRLGKELGLIDESKFNFLWVTDWPQFEFFRRRRSICLCSPSIHDAKRRRYPVIG